MKKYVVIWMSGFFFALVMAERWRRMGGASVTSVVDRAEPTESPAPTIARRARSVASTASKSVVVGAKADLARIRQLPERVRPDRHSEAPAAADQAKSADDEALPVASDA